MMPSTTELDAQIAALIAQRTAAAEEERHAAEVEAQRKSRILAKGSPSPKKARPALSPQPKLVKRDVNSLKQPDAAQKPAEKPSKFLDSLAKSRSGLQEAAVRRDQPRATGFTDKAKEAQPAVRDAEDLTVIENLQLGPRQFRTPEDDPTWQGYEPYSKIRLKSRSLPHDDLQEYMDGRYHLTPSQLYSIVRPTRGGSELEVPIDGDFIIIGVLAEKSQIKTTNPSAIKIEHEEDDTETALLEKDDDGQAKKKRKVGGGQAMRKPKKFVGFKLVDLGRKGATGGDAILSVMLFEADAATFAETGEDSEEEITAGGVRVQKELRGKRAQQKRYAGGSGGAYERFWKENDGAVVAILNPKLMKPRPAGNGFAASNVITLTPESADSMLILGRARDLGHCQALRLDKTPCGSWCDTRVQQVCEYHSQEALRRTRSGRSELLSGHPNSTTGMQTATLGKRGGKAVGPDFDRKTGLLAHDNKRLVEGNATWIISGPKQPARANGNGPPSAFSRSALFNSSAETAAAGGSGKQGKTEKQRMQEDHNLVRKLQKRDGGKTVGGKYLMASTSKEAMPPAEGESEEEGDKSIKAGKKAFASSHLRKLGFDPTRKEDAVRTADESVDEQRQKLEAPTGIKRTIGKRVQAAESDEEDFVVMPEGVTSLLEPKPKKSRHGSRSPPPRPPRPAKPTSKPKSKIAAEVMGVDGDDEMQRLVGNFRRSGA